jgi:hypothetical protein
MQPPPSAAAPGEEPEMVSKEHGSQTNNGCDPEFEFAQVNQRSEKQQDQLSRNWETQIFQQQAEEDGQVSVIL